MFTIYLQFFDYQKQMLKSHITVACFSESLLVKRN